MTRPGRPRKYDPIADEISLAIQDGNIDIAQKKINEHDTDILDGDARTPLIWSAFYDSRSLLSWLIDKDANLDHQDRNGYCALHFAAQECNDKIVNILLKAGASTELRDVYGNTPLWTAAFNARGNYTVFSALLSSGASLKNENNAGKTVAEMAAMLFKDEYEVIVKNAT